MLLFNNFKRVPLRFSFKLLWTPNHALSNQYYFCTQKQKKQQEKDHNLNGPEIIEVSHEQYLMMREMLKQMKSEIKEMEDSKGQSLMSSSNNGKTEQTGDSQEPEKLQFDTLEQKVSLKLMQIHSKEQIQGYIQFFEAAHQDFEKASIQERQEIIQCYFLIFYRYCSLEGGHSYDSAIKQTLHQLASNIDFLDESSVVLLLSIFVREMTDNSDKTSLKLLERSLEFFKEEILKDKKIYNINDCSNRNSNLVSLLSHIGINGLQLEENWTDEQGNVLKVIYNPLNISHALIKDQSIAFEKLFLNSIDYFLSLSVDQTAMTKRYIPEDSLENLSKERLRQLLFEGVILILQNDALFNRRFELISQLIDQQSHQIKGCFSNLQRMRVALALISKRQPGSIQISKMEDVAIKTINSVMTLGVRKLCYFQQNCDSQDSENSQFLHVQSAIMLLNQIGIQFYKNYRPLQSEKGLESQLQEVDRLSTIINAAIAQICLEVIEVKELAQIVQQESEDPGNSAQTQNSKVLVLQLFDFILNFSIAYRWNQQNQQSQNVKHLIKCSDFEAALKQLIMTYLTREVGPFSDQNKGVSKRASLEDSQRLTIILLLATQQISVWKSLEETVFQNEAKTAEIVMLLEKIMSQPTHKYFEHSKSLKAKIQKCRL